MPTLSPPEWAFVLVVVALGAAVQGSVGFGMNVLAAPLVVQVEPRLVPGPLLVGALVLTTAVTLRERSHLRLGDLGWAFAGRLPGVGLGVVLVATLSTDALGVVLASVVLVAVAVSVTGGHVPFTRGTLLAAGFASGTMGTATSVGGPPMALLYQHGRGGDVRANLSGFFTLGASVSVVVLAAAGEFDAGEARLALVLVPAVLVGFLVSGWTRRHVDRGRLRPAVLTLSAASALSLLIRSLL